MELCFLIIYAVDIGLKFYTHDKREIGRWTYIVIGVMFVNFVLTLMLSILIVHTKNAESSVIATLFLIARVGRPFY